MHACTMVCMRDARVCIVVKSGGRCDTQKCYNAIIKVIYSAIYVGDISELSRERFGDVSYLSVRQVVMKWSRAIVRNGRRG